MKRDEFEASGHVKDVSVPGTPDSDTPPNAPINWPAWKRNAQILMVAVHSMDSVFMAAGIVPGYEGMAEEYNISVPKATYLTSVMVSQFSQVFRVVLTPDLPIIDPSPWSRPLLLDSYHQPLWPLPHLYALSAHYHGMQHRSRLLQNLWHADGHSRAGCLVHLASAWYR